MGLWSFVAYLREKGWLRKKSLRGKHVYITGAAMGIGRLMALKMARMGAKMTVVDINMPELQKTQGEIEAAGGECLALKVNCTSLQDIQDSYAACTARFGTVDVLINNAGIVSGKRILDADFKKMKLTLEVNTLAHFYTVKTFLPDMIKQNWGHVVTVASSAGHVGVRGLADYCSSKFGAVGFDDSLR